MEIIENNCNFAQELSLYDKTCPHCNSKLRYAGGDVHAGADYDFIICPCCQKKIDISEPYICEYCGKEFFGKEYEGEYGLYFVDCPHCKSANMLDKSIELTPDNVIYPKHFSSYVNGKNIKDAEINQWIKECLNDLNKEVDYSYHASGDSLVIALKTDESLHTAQIVVAKKYQETEVEIPIEKY